MQLGYSLVALRQAGLVTAAGVSCGESCCLFALPPQTLLAPLASHCNDPDIRQDGEVLRKPPLLVSLSIKQFFDFLAFHTRVPAVLELLCFQPQVVYTRSETNRFARFENGCPFSGASIPCSRTFSARPSRITLIVSPSEMPTTRPEKSAARIVVREAASVRIPAVAPIRPIRKNVLGNTTRQ
jgi:hypothetical protein